MAKKSSYARQRPNPAQGKSAQQKPQGAATLVRTGAESTPSAANVVEEKTTASATPAAKPAAKPATPAANASTAAARPGTAVSTREQNLRMARARATQAARTKNLITPENYTYVLGDLKLVIGLAVTAFVVLIALTFVLPH